MNAVVIHRLQGAALNRISLSIEIFITFNKKMFLIFDYTAQVIDVIVITRSRDDYGKYNLSAR